MGCNNNPIETLLAYGLAAVAGALTVLGVQGYVKRATRLQTVAMPKAPTP